MKLLNVKRHGVYFITEYFYKRMIFHRNFDDEPFMFVPSIECNNKIKIGETL